MCLRLCAPAEELSVFRMTGNDDRAKGVIMLKDKVHIDEKILDYINYLKKTKEKSKDEAKEKIRVTK